MNYEKSAKILKEINKSKKILVNCHRSPDPDSIGSAMAMYWVLKGMGKDVTIVSPNEIGNEYDFLKGYEKIEKINFKNFIYKDFDLFITLDSSNWRMVTGVAEMKPFDMSIAVIDHHKTKGNYGKINLVDDKVSSCAEVLYQVFMDWKVKINKDIATALLTGILGDTGVFRYPGVTSRTFDIARELMALGADKEKIVYKVFGSLDFMLVKFLGEILRRFEMDKEHSFVWAAIPYDVFEEYGKPLSGKETAASLFSQVVNDTDFGFIAVEERKGTLSISFRSRTGFDVSVLAEKLGGGGHKAASGAKIEGLGFDEAVKKLLKVAMEASSGEKDKE
jgi:phosphoesterase RecJ-like protein